MASVPLPHAMQCFTPLAAAKSRSKLRTNSPCRSAGAECIVDEHDAMANETVVTNGDEVANERVRLDATPCADRRATLNLDERADKRPCTDPTSVQVHRPNHAHAFTEIDVGNVGVEECWPAH